MSDQTPDTHAAYPGSGLARCGAPAGAYTVAPGEPYTCTACPPPAGGDPDRPCPHLDFDAVVEVNRLARSDDDPTIVGYSATIRVWCKDPVCRERFRWIGVPAGLLPTQPACSVDETELHAPLRPASSDPDFGMGLPGYAISVRFGDDDQ